MAPPSKSAMEFGPPSVAERVYNDSIVDLPKSNDFGPPVSLSAMDLAPLRKNTTRKH